MADPTKPTREQLAAAIGNNPRLIEAFGRLFDVAGDETPTDLLTLILDSAIANSKANEAIATINRLSNAIELAALAPRAELGTIATQNQDLIDIDGGNIDEVLLTSCTLEGGEHNNADFNNDTIVGSELNDSTGNNDTITSSSFNDGTLGNNTLTGGSVTSNVSDNQTRLIRSSVTLSDNSGAGAGTLTNAPTAGDPTKWIAIDDNGTTRKIPTWL